MGQTGRSPVRATLAVLASLALVATLSGCDAAVTGGFPPAMFRPASPQAGDIYGLAVVILIIAAIVFVVVEGWLLIDGFRFRNRSEEQAVQSHGNLRLEVGWTVVTAVVIFTVLGFTVKTMVDVTALPVAAAVPSGAFPGEVVNLNVNAHQWWWEFEYSGQGVVTGNEVHVPVGRTIRAQVESADVIHSFWIPQLGRKIDAIPGHTNYTSFLAAAPGVYHGLCAEYCGTQHAHMGFRIIADPLPTFTAWLKDQQAPAAQPTTDQQRAGLEVVSTVCSACHTVRGTPAQAKVGPDLTHIASRQTIAADFLDNTPQNLATWLRDPQAVKPGNKMPNLNLDQATINNLVAYLENLK